MLHVLRYISYVTWIIIKSTLIYFEIQLYHFKKESKRVKCFMWMLSPLLKQVTKPWNQPHFSVWMQIKLPVLSPAKPRPCCTAMHAYLSLCGGNKSVSRMLGHKRKQKGGSAQIKEAYLYHTASFSRFLTVFDIAGCTCTMLFPSVLMHVEIQYLSNCIHIFVFLEMVLVFFLSSRW